MSNHRDSSGIVSTDQRGLYLSENDRTAIGVRKWDEELILQAFAGHVMAVKSVALSADGKLLASGSIDNTIKLWDTSTLRIRHSLESHKHWVTSVALSSAGSILASGSMDNTVKLWDVDAGRLKSVCLHSWVPDFVTQCIVIRSVSRTRILWLGRNHRFAPSDFRPANSLVNSTEQLTR